MNDTLPNELSQDTTTQNTVEKVLKPNQFQKGHDARRNLAGKPKGARHFSTLIREAIQKVAEGDAEPTDILIVKKLAKKAKEGDLKAMDIVFDRVDGKAEQTINLDGELTVNDGLTQEEKEALVLLLK